jgi:hypothetical protein
LFFSYCSKYKLAPLLQVAFKVDGLTPASWQIAFLVPWLWLSSLCVLAFMVVCLLLASRVWSRLHELMLPSAFCCLLLAVTPHFACCTSLVQYLEGNMGITWEVSEQHWNEAVECLSKLMPSMQAILVPTAVAWFAMYAAGLALVYALRQRERLRDALAAVGAVWTAHEGLARRLAVVAEREEETRRIDALSGEARFHMKSN